MTSTPPPEPATAMTMAAATAAFPSSDASPTSITTNFLALVGFAARLGTCVNNDASSAADEEGTRDDKSVRDEAMLLMSLLMGNKAEEILSEEIGAKESRCQKRKTRARRPKDQDMANNFSFTFPSLSLQPDESSGGATAADEVEAADAAPGTEGEGHAQEDEDKDAPPPSKLLSRTQSVSDKDAIRDCSEAMAQNVLESFGAALVWRAKSWIKSLANVLALKEQERIEGRGSSNGAVEVEVEAEEEEGEGEEKEEEKKERPQHVEISENDDLMNSKEMQIIDAIVKSSEEVAVVNVKTAFRVLPNRVSQQISPTRKQDPQEASPKKKAKKTASPSGKTRVFKVTHKLAFEATVSMTSNDGVRYNGVKLQAPGYIQGTFASNGPGAGDAGDETLTGVSMMLDTDTLALSLERQSRLVVRRAAEAALVAASGAEVSSSPQHAERPHVHHSVISPRYVLMSPVPAFPTVPTYPTIDEMNAPAGLPPARSVGGRSDGEDASVGTEPRPAAAVSSSEGHSSDSSSATASTTPTLAPRGATVAPQSPSLPALLSVANEELSRGIQ